MATASEDQPQPVVFDLFIVPRNGSPRCGADPLGESSLHGFEAAAPSHGINSFETAGGNEPCSWVPWHAFPRPPFQRCRKGIVQRVLGEVKVADEADQSGV